MNILILVVVLCSFQITCYAATFTLQKNRTEPTQADSPSDETTITIVMPNKASSTTIKMTATTKKKNIVKLNPTLCRDYCQWSKATKTHQIVDCKNAHKPKRCRKCRNRHKCFRRGPDIL